MLKFTKQAGELKVYKDGEKLYGELYVSGRKVNKSNAFLVDLAPYEGQTLNCVIDEKKLFYSNTLIKEYSSVFEEGTILDLYIDNNSHTGKVMFEDVVLEAVRTNLNLSHYKISVKNDNDYTVVRFANIHQHTENSLLDSIVKIPELAKKIEYCSAITDHGNMFGWYDFKKAMESAGKKPIIGEEFYMETLGGPKPVVHDDLDDTEEMMFDKSKEQNKDGLNGEHLIVLAKNSKGIKNLFKLSSLASEHFYKKPHITFELLKEHKEGLIVCSACIGSGLNQFIKEYLKASRKPEVSALISKYGEYFYRIENRDDWSENENVYIYNHKKSREYINWFVSEFGSDFYLEYQDHEFSIEKLIMDEMVRIRNTEYPNVRIIATTDAHYLNEDDAYVHELWLCCQTKKTINDPKHMKFKGTGYHVHTSREMIQKFPVEYLDNTLYLADSISYDKDEKGYHLPTYPLPPQYKNEEDALRYISFEGFKKKFYGKPQYTDKVYRDRLKFEFETIIQMGWPAYFLIVADFIKWAQDTDVRSHWQDYFPNKKLEEIPKELLDKERIYVGSGRGSAAGSLICYCMGITKVDPIVYDLKFERFLNPDRISMPDIDTDFEDENRGKVLDYARFKYGQDKVASIITFTTKAAKESIKAINRTLGGSVAQGEELSGLIPEDPKMTIEKAFNINPDLSERYNRDPEAKKIIDLAKRVEGLKSAQSIHACGELICDRPISDYMPECIMKDPDDPTKTVWVTQMEGPLCEELGCLKMDFLGLRTLGYVKETIDSIKRNTGHVIDYDRIPLNDIRVYKYLAEGNTQSVFQCESDMFTTVIKKTLQDIKRYSDNDLKMGDECFNRLVAMNALVRPGSNQFIDDFADRIIHPEHVEYLVPELEPILKETYGIILYQEQTMRITRDLAGFSAGQADTVRKAMGKKKKYIMDEYRDYFIHGNVEKKIKGCVANGINEKKAAELWDIMALASSYSFNKSHAVAYSMHSIRTAWLSYYYPFEYITGVLNSYSKPERIAQYLTFARNKGMKILAPSINKSGHKFTTDGKAILAGFAGIKGMSLAAEDIFKERGNGLFKDINDVLDRMSYYKSFNKKTLESLILSGMLDEFGGTRKDKLDNAEIMAKYVSKTKEYREKIQIYNEKLSAYNEAIKTYVKAKGNKKPRMPKEPQEPQLLIVNSGKEMDKFELLIKEKEYTGMFLSGNPMDLFKGAVAGTQDCSRIFPGKTMVSGIIEDPEKGTTKKGSTYWKFKLSNNGTLDCVAFRYEGDIQKNTPVIVKGTIRVDSFGATLNVIDIYDIEEQERVTAEEVFG